MPFSSHVISSMELSQEQINSAGNLLQDLMNGDANYSTVSDEASLSLRKALNAVQGVLALVVLAIAMFSVLIALIKKGGCLYWSRRTKIYGHVFFACMLLLSIVISCLMYNIITQILN